MAMKDPLGTVRNTNKVFVEYHSADVPNTFPCISKLNFEMSAMYGNK